MHKGRESAQISKCTQKMKIVMVRKCTNTNLERGKTNPEFGNSLLVFNDRQRQK